jgi:hypothetical protein
MLIRPRSAGGPRLAAMKQTQTGTALQRFVARVAARVGEAYPEAAGRFLPELHAIAAASSPEPCAGPELPVLRHWPEALARAAAVDRELAGALAELSPALRWRQNPNYVRRARNS